MHKWIIAVTILMLAGSPARAGSMFDSKGSFSFKEMLKSFASFFSPQAEPTVQKAAALPANLSPEQAKAWLETDTPALLDIRTPEEYAQGRLKDSQLMDFYAPDFAERLGKLDKGAKYLIYCRSGKRSGKALETMAGLGFTQARDIEGGINAWIAAGLPTVN
jgi:phage shock protein E